MCIYKISGVLDWGEITRRVRFVQNECDSKMEWTYRLYKMSISTWLSLLQQALTEDM